MTVVLAAQFREATVLLADVFAAYGPLDDASCYKIEEKVFAFDHPDTFLGVRGDAAFASILKGEAQCPGEDLNLQSGDPFDSRFMDDLATRASTYRRISEAYAAQHQVHAMGFMDTSVYAATRSRLLRWTFVHEGNGYRRDGEPLGFTQGLVRVDCGCMIHQQAYPNKATATFSELAPLMECSHLGYGVGTAITGVWLPASEGEPRTLRGLDEIPGGDKEIRLKHKHT